MNSAELLVMRREMDKIQIERIAHLESRFDDLNERVERELHDLDDRIQSKLERAELALADKAAKIAVKQAFHHMGVDVDSPVQLQQFRDDLRFGGVFRNAATRGFFAMLAAICGGIGLSIWLVFKSRLGMP